jgi:hypothetical protein
MAKFIGTAGGFQKERGIKRRMDVMMWLFLLMVVTFFSLGFATAKASIWWSLAAAVAILPAYRVYWLAMDKELRKARMDDDGAAGEREILPHLKSLPDSYTVISDLDFAESYGNIDHLVIGPTGVFAIDVKNWRGTVSADGKGELLYNGQPTDKPQVRYFTRRVMDLKDRLKALTKLEPYIQCVFAFPRTRVEANWGTTGSVHCIRAEQIADYVTKGRGGKPIPATDIPRLVKAAEALKSLVPAYGAHGEQQGQS